MARPKKTKAYNVILSLGGKDFTCTGDTIFEALSSLTPVSEKAFGSFTITHDGKQSKIPIRLNSTKLKRIFANRWEMEILAKRLQTLL